MFPKVTGGLAAEDGVVWAVVDLLVNGLDMVEAMFDTPDLTALVVVENTELTVVPMDDGVGGVGILEVSNIGMLLAICHPPTNVLLLINALN